MMESDFEQFELTGSAVLADFVPVVFADSLAQAQRLSMLLEECRIPTFVETQNADLIDPSVSRGVPVLVPSEVFDEASEVLAALEDDDDEDEFEVDYDDDEEDDFDDDEDDFDDDLDDFEDEEDDDDDDLFFDDDEDDEY